ncbi:MAG: LppX_LprAFG lipoprotein [Pseudonocardiaceae bacterium]
MLCRLIALMLMFALGAAGGCTSAPAPAPQAPDAQALAEEAADSLEDLRSATVTLRTTGAIPGLVVHKAEARIRTEGGAAGSGRGEATIYRADGSADVEFTLADDTLTVVHENGDRSRLRAHGSYLPATLFSRDGPLGTMLTSATGLRTEATEEMDGVTTYRLGGELSRSVISSLLPQVTSDVQVKFWVGGPTAPALYRVWIQVPPPRPNQGAAMLEVGISEHNQPIPATR